MRCPEKLIRIVKGLARDGFSEDGGKGSLRMRPLDSETIASDSREIGPRW